MAGEAVKTVALVKLEPQDLLRLAVENKADISTLERLVALAKDVRAEQAKEAWHDAMTAFQQACPAIKKGTKAKIVTRAGASYEYSYAPLDDIMAILRCHPANPEAGAKLLDWLRKVGNSLAFSGYTAEPLGILTPARARRSASKTKKRKKR